MKVFIRSTKTGWFYQDPSKWTPKQDVAQDLGAVAKAVERIFSEHLENVEILLSYDEPRYDLVLAVPPTPSRSDPLKAKQVSEEGRQGENHRRGLSRKKGHPL